MFVLYSYFLKSGIPLLKGIHRTIYFESAPYYINFLKGRLNFVSLVLGYLFFKTNKKRYLLYFFSIIFYFLLCSIKGGDLIGAIWYFSLPILLTINFNKNIDKMKMIKKIRLILVSFFIFIFIVIAYAYQKTENYNKETTSFEKIIERIESAGQVWWYFNDSNQIEAKYRHDKFLDNFNIKKSKFEKGMNQLMTEIIPKEKLVELRKEGARYYSLANGNGFPAIGYYHFKYFGVFLLIFITGYFIYKIKIFVLKACLSDDILSFLFLAIILEVTARIVAQGDIQLLLEKRTVFVLLLMGSYKIIKLGVRK
jgi:hypothetical protein